MGNLYDSFAGYESFATRASSAVLRRFSHAGVGGPLRQGTVAGVTLNTLCNVMGAGILSLPAAMYHASISMGMALLTLCALASAAATYIVACGCEATGKESYAEMLAHSLWPETPEPPLNRPTRARQAMDRDASPPNAAVHLLRERAKAVNRQRALVLVEVIVFLNNFGALIIYSRVIADSIPPVVANFLNGSGIWVDKVTWLLLSGVVFFALSCVRNMEELKWTSFVGFVTILYVIVVVIMRYFTLADSRPPEEQIRWFSLSGDTLRAMSSYGVAFGYHYNVPYFYKELQDRRPANFMLSVLFSLPIIYGCYAATGVMGYLTFGDEVGTHGGDVVTNYPPNDVVVNVGRLGLFFHFACVFPVLAVCARRGLHRLIVLSLSKIAQGCCGVPTAGGVVAESLKVPIGEGEGKPTEVAVPTTYGADGQRLDSAEEGSDRLGLLSEAAPPAERNNEDLGRPEDTTRLAIIVEALTIVSASVLLAGVVSGIDVVIDVIGTVFGLTLMLVIPGLVGVLLFSYSFHGEGGGGMEGLAGDANPRGDRIGDFSYFTSVTRTFAYVDPFMKVISWALLIAGVIFVVCGVVTMIIHSAS